jgi:hypothetical protein
MNADLNFLSRKRIVSRKRIESLIKRLVDDQYIGTKSYCKMKRRIHEEAMMLFNNSSLNDDIPIHVNNRINFIKCQKEASKYINNIIANEVLMKMPLIEEEEII